ncbi:winged helix-turn-helix transcriptional regulator [Lactovum miscens]|uniref:DNA-binding HxlR family transcriptional regulator n=1 Tax=Lactovum miscens TaxID=190387 RepID=A0A841C622_9LACT|nr:helix-turn-helix domain-containing protein [Lactovum miscens]MBB5887198.1 DNA-binding HxlR family transcriptional regulator [Lactovum miscens]
MTDLIRQESLNRISKGDFGCFKELTLAMFSGKWKINILYHLYHDGDYHFNNLTRLLPRASRKMLAQQLNELREDGLISKKYLKNNNIIYTVYSLTPLGKSLIPILDMMYDWGKNRVSDLKLDTTCFQLSNKDL